MKKTDKKAKKQRILIVEDEANYAKLLKSQLVERGFLVDIAENGLEAMKLTREKKPCLVVLDIIMPKMDGYQYLEKLRADEELDEIQVLVLSNLGTDKKKDLIKKWKILDFILKTEISLVETLNMIEKICR